MMIKKTLSLLFLMLSTPLLASGVEFQWQNEENTTINLSSLQGKPVVLHFWASWCPPCRGEMPSLVKWIAAHPDVTVVMVSVDRAKKDARAFFAQHSIKLPLNMGKMSDIFALGVRGLPATLIIGTQGDISKRRIGDIQWDDPKSSDEVLRWL